MGRSTKSSKLIYKENELHYTKMKFFIKDFLSKCDQFRSFLQISSHLLMKSLMESFIFCAVLAASYITGARHKK